MMALLFYRVGCTACAAGAITVFVMWAVGMEPGEFWRW